MSSRQSDCTLPPTRTLNVMDQFLEKAKGLKQISFIPNINTGRKQPMTATEIESMTKKLLTDHPSLEFIYLSTRGHFERICNAIHQGLFRTQSRERNSLEIKLHLDCSEIEDLTDFMCNIHKIVVVLSGSKTKEWMLTLERHKFYRLNPMAKAIGNLISSYPGLDIKLLHHSWSTLIIGNSECRALTHQHWWNDIYRTDFY